jgi:hypothetical protein
VWAVINVCIYYMYVFTRNQLFSGANFTIVNTCTVHVQGYGRYTRSSLAFTGKSVCMVSEWSTVGMIYPAGEEESGGKGLNVSVTHTNRVMAHR